MKQTLVILRDHPPLKLLLIPTTIKCIMYYLQETLGRHIQGYECFIEMAEAAKLYGHIYHQSLDTKRKFLLCTYRNILRRMFSYWWKTPSVLNAIWGTNKNSYISSLFEQKLIPKYIMSEQKTVRIKILILNFVGLYSNKAICYISY